MPSSLGSFLPHIQKLDPDKNICNLILFDGAKIVQKVYNWFGIGACHEPYAVIQLHVIKYNGEKKLGLICASETRMTDKDLHEWLTQLGVFLQPESTLLDSIGCVSEEEDFDESARDEDDNVDKRIESERVESESESWIVSPTKEIMAGAYENYTGNNKQTVEKFLAMLLFPPCTSNEVEEQC
eukprot:15360375-Ditylum_brightwellii.AAC.1